jgi:serine/threonine-protein kinase
VTGDLGSVAGALFGDRFRLGALLGVGGSAAVYAAADTWRPGPDGLPTTVALKVLHPHLGGTPAARDAFLAEARAVRGLRHPNVAQVHDAGLDGSSGLTTAWLALDLVPGGSLADLLALRGPLPPAEVVAVLDGVLAALDAAHAVGLVHRDVSPANVLLTELRPDGPRSQDVRLVDFGLADAVGRDARGVHVLPHGGARCAGTEDAPDPVGVVGNALYLSPEHARGEPVGPAGDLYQVGALAHVLLTGCPPFSRDTVEQVLRAHLTAPPPAPSVLAPAARALDRVVTRAMQKDPADRYADAGQMRVALAEALAGRSSWSATGVAGALALGGTRALGTAASDDLAYLDAVGAEVDTRSPDRAVGVGAGVGVGIAAVLGVALWGVLSAGGPGDAAAPTPSAPVTSTAPAAPVAEPTALAPAGPAGVEQTLVADPTVVPVSVPVLAGTLADAQRALADAGLTLGTVDRVPSAEAADRVLGQQPAAGQTALPGAPVQVTVASGSSTVPQVSGMTVAGARAVLESAGFRATTDQTDPGPTATVTGSQPAAGAVLRVGVTVTLVVAARVPTPAPTGGAPAQP